MRSDQRGISIGPAWNIVIKKILSPVIKYLPKGKLAFVHFGGKEVPDCGVAKLLLNYRSIKFGL